MSPRLVFDRLEAWDCIHHFHFVIFLYSPEEAFCKSSVAFCVDHICPYCRDFNLLSGVHLAGIICSLVELEVSSNGGSMLVRTSVQTLWHYECPQLLEFAPQDCTRFWIVYQGWIAGQSILMSHGMPQLPSYLGILGWALFLSEAPCLHGYLEFAVQALAYTTQYGMFPCYLESLGRAQPGAEQHDVDPHLFEGSK